MIAAYFLKAHGHAKHGEGRLMDAYMSTLRWTLRHRWSAVVGGYVPVARG
jgi:multidrug efflux pump subunit AcrB